MSGDATSSTDTQREKDIVDHLSEATGYFHDSEAAKLRDIADASGQKPVGVVRAGVEKEIEKREWRCVHFEHSEGDEYPSWNAYEYYQIHKAHQLEYEDAISELSYENVYGEERFKSEFEGACETLREKAREHRAKADVAEQYLNENGIELPEVDRCVETDTQHNERELGGDR
jgi:hypothetical protein